METVRQRLTILTTSRGFAACFLFLLGAGGYGMLELLWRGRTHPSMLLAGGLCLLAICRLGQQLGGRSRVVQALAGALLITGVELAFGLVVNVWLGLDVWDYSGVFGNLWGQVCLPYTALWFVLCLTLGRPAAALNDWLMS